MLQSRGRYRWRQVAWLPIRGQAPGRWGVGDPRRLGDRWGLGDR
jgi:hypothetical protein